MPPGPIPLYQRADVLYAMRYVAPAMGLDCANGEILEWAPAKLRKIPHPATMAH